MSRSREAPESAAPARDRLTPPSDRAAAESVVDIQDDAATVALSGRLDASTLLEIWRPTIDPLADAEVSRISVDASKVTYCDGAGLGLFVEIDRLARAAGGGATFSGLPEELSRLLERGLIRDEPPKQERRNAVEQIGAATASIWRDIVSEIAFLGEATAALAWAVTHPRRIRWGDTLLIAEKAGVNAVPVVCLLGWLVGLIISFQSATPLKRFAADSTIPMLLSISMVRELGPLFTAIILAGRSGSAFAAEIGTMKVTEEINALTTFGLAPTRFLVVPRLLAALVMTPLLSVLCTLAGLLGGYLVMVTLGYTLSFYVNEIRKAVDYLDLLQGLFKSCVFALLVCGVGCHRGLNTASGPGAVGDSTTRAVVAGIVLVVAADGVMGVVFYFLGI